jgi:hypothetical protein
MAFKPKKTIPARSGGSDFDYSTLPTPKDGPRPARISLIVDLGTQPREDYVDEKTGETRPQKPCHQVAIFADLVNDVVDYGGDIGEQPYRLCLNKTYQGKLQGINFQTVPPKTEKGELIKGKPWMLPGANLITKLCKAVGRPEIAIEDRKNPASLDLELLLGLPFMAQVEVKVTEKDMDDGTKKTYKNVNYRGASPIPSIPEIGEDGEPTGEEKPMPVKKLPVKPRVITFDGATVDDIKVLRAGIIRIIKQANDYEGSQIQKAIEAYEAQREEAGESSEEEAPAPAPAPAKKAAPKKPVKPVVPDPADEDDSDAPF